MSIDLEDITSILSLCQTDCVIAYESVVRDYMYPGDTAGRRVVLLNIE